MARFLILIFLVVPFIAMAEVSDAPPAMPGELRLRKDEGKNPVAPKISDTPLRETPALRVAPVEKNLSLAQAQAAALRAPEAWRNWAALANAHYSAGDYDKAFEAANQMRAAAKARNESLPLEADELFAKYKRAAEALSLLE